MNIIFSDEKLPNKVTKSIFLAGPSPREETAKDWRDGALEALREANFTGEVFIPIPRLLFYSKKMPSDFSYDNQIAWECEARSMADVILFWVARDIKGLMPAFTTNIEFGEDLNSGKVIYGRPDHAEKCQYLDARAKEIGIKVNKNLPATISEALQKLGSGAKREEGECQVPLYIWNTDQFKSWYKDLKDAGNRLDGAKVLSSVIARSGFVFCYSLKVNVWVEKEKRNKINEFVFSRKDISSILAYHKEGDDIEIVLVKEFRSPVSNNEGFVFELPGGSAPKNGVDPRLNAQHELEEETGLHLEDIERFSFVESRQLMATICTHKSHLFKVELSREEMKSLKDAKGKVFGVIEDSEMTYVEVVKLKDILSYPLDFSMLGMIFAALK